MPLDDYIYSQEAKKHMGDIHCKDCSIHGRLDEKLKITAEKADDAENGLKKKMGTVQFWVASGVIVAIFTILSLLSYDAYSQRQEVQDTRIANQNTVQQELVRSRDVLDVKINHINDNIEKLQKSIDNSTVVQAQMMKILQEVRDDRIKLEEKIDSLHPQ